jgi:DNA-binding GntR family transcriptional regulator
MSIPLDMHHLTLRDRIRNELVRMIMSGELPSGAPIEERVIVDRLSISRTPFREAIAALAKEGLVETRPYRGCVVRSFTFQEVFDLYEVRKSLECTAARLAATRVSPAQIEKLTGILDASLAALEAGDMPGYAIADREFHNVIAQWSGNRILVETLERLSLQIQICRVTANQNANLVSQTAQERNAILDAFRRRDGARAAELMDIHISTVQNSLAERLRTHSGDHAALDTPSAVKSA